MVFTFASGNLALDLTGTVGRRRTEKVELITGPDALGAWFTASGLGFVSGRFGENELQVTLRLREAVYSLALAASEQRPRDPRSRTQLNRLAAMPPPVPSMSPDGSVVRKGDFDAALSLIARSAIEMLAGEQPGRIRECAGGECTRLYIDASPRGSRRWCDMQLCGNQAKVANFRSRQPNHHQDKP